jgi:hypothetical protein
LKLLETWVKAPGLKDASILVMSECAQAVFPDLCREFRKGHVVLTSCPTAENHGVITEKLASIITCSHPRRITLLTVDGSPHCLMLHTAVNQALFLTKADISAKHYVIADGEAVEVSPESVRVGRYLHLIERCIKRQPDILDELSRHSLEQESATNRSEPVH